jgi:hypothetical protein
MVLHLPLFRMENRICSSRSVQVVGATRRAAMMIVTGVGDMVQRSEDSQAQVGYSVARQSGGRMTPCVVCIVHMETRSVGFLVEPQNQGRRFISGLALKPLRRFVSGLASKPLEQFLPV